VNSNEGIWTAILINGTWHLADVDWGSKGINGVNEEWELVDDNGKGAREFMKPKRKITYEYDEFYFLTNPEQFIYTHFPNETKWQLLARPVTLEEFSQMAILHSHFFEYELHFKSHKRCVESAPEGYIKIELEFPPYSDYRFRYRLWISKGNKNLFMYKDKKLQRFAFMEVHDGTVCCTIEFPVSGKYKIEFLCNDNTVSDTYFHVCEYTINAEKAQNNARFYPESSCPHWGPSHDLEAVGLTPISHKRGMVYLNKEEMEMSFSAEKNVTILTKLQSNTLNVEIMKGYVVHWFADNKVILKMRFPEVGDYVLNIFAKENDDENDGLSNVCSYLISTDHTAMDKSPFFVSGNVQLGANLNFDMLRMKAVSHPTPFIVDPKNGQMDFSFETPTPCDLTAELILCRDNKEQKMEGFTFIVKKIGEAAITARFPEKGNYTLNLYGKEKNNDGLCHLVFVYFILINNEPAVDKSPFFMAGNGCSQLGANDNFDRLCMKADSHPTPYIVDPKNGQMDFSFETPIPCDLTAELILCRDNKEHKMEGFTFIVKKIGEATITARFPEKGNYTLNLYGKEKSKDELYHLVFVYFIVINNEPAVDKSPFFMAENGCGQLGANDNFDTLCMKAVSHPTPYIVDPKNGQMQLSFETPIPCNLTAKLILCRDNKEQQIEGFTFIVKKIGDVTIMARFPEKGNYMLEIYGKQKNKDGPCYLAFVYLIVVHQPMSDCYQFPKTFNPWTDGCELLQPAVGSPLFTDQTIPFVVKVPEAHDVAVIHPTAGWTHLTKDNQQMWRGDVNTGSEAGQIIQLFAGFDAKSNSYSQLLEFKVSQYTSLLYNK